MSDIILFDFENQEIRFVGTAENPEWIADDICKALDLEDTSKAISTLKSDEAGTTNLRIRSENGVEQERQVLTVKEKGLYRLIFKSRKPAAERMKDWVFSEVLPSIRKTGKYSIPESPKPQQLLIEQSLKVPHSYTVSPQAVRFVKLGDSCTIHNRTRIGVFKAPLDTPLRQMPKVVLTFLMIFAAPLQSLLMYRLLAVRYKPRLTRFPLGFHPSGFAPKTGRESESRKLALDVYDSSVSTNRMPCCSHN